MSKQEQVIKLLKKNPSLKSLEVATLVGCSMRTVSYARDKLEPRKKENVQPSLQPESCNSAMSLEFANIDPVDLLMSKCMEMLNRSNPDSRWGTILKDILKNTGRLDIKLQSEEDYKLYLTKLPEDKLVQISTGKESLSNSLQEEEQEDSLYL